MVLEILREKEQQIPSYFKLLFMPFQLESTVKIFHFVERQGGGQYKLGVFEKADAIGQGSGLGLTMIAVGTEKHDYGMFFGAEVFLKKIG